MNINEAYATTAYLVMAYINGSLAVAPHDKLNMQLVAHNMMQARNGKPVDNLRLLFSVLQDLKWGFYKEGFNVASADRMLLIHTHKEVGRLMDGVRDGTIVL